MNGRKWLILLLAIVTVMSLATYTGVTRSLFTDDEHSTNDALVIRWGLFTLNEDFEDTVDWDVNWDENGTTTWVQDTAKPHGGIYNAYSDLNSNGYLTTDEIEASTADNITVSFWFNTKAVEAGDLLVQRYNGTSYITWYDITSHPSYVNNAWCEFSEVITDPQYLIAGFRLRFDTTALVDTNEEANIDDVIIATDTVPPSAPTGLAATPGNEQISLTWASNNETDLWGYNVYRGPTSGNYTQINASVVISSTYTDTPLYGGGTYYYAVTAVDLGNNESGYSDEASDTAVDIAPAVPTGLTANQSEFQMSLDWNDNIETDLEGYNVYRGLTSGNYTKIESLWTSSNYTDTGLTNGITYYYAVTATDNGTYESGDSNEASDTPVDIPPAAPTGLGATPGDEQISLVWDDNTEIDLEGYNIYRGPSSGNYTQIESLWTSSNYTDTPLYGGGTYYYAVKAVDTADPVAYESGYSDEASDT
ncbi:fibronectin type III domain-containing protein, partial [Chloroflexota bacterium]